MSLEDDTLHDRLLAACRTGDLPMVQSLCEFATDRSLLHCIDVVDAMDCACSHGHGPVVQRLCELDVDLPPSALTKTQFAAFMSGVEWAARRDEQLPLMRFLCELALSRPELEVCLKRENFAFLLAVEINAVAVVRYLCDLAQTHPKLELNVCSHNYYAVRHAAIKGRVAMVRCLCEHPAVNPALLLCRIPHLSPDVREAMQGALDERLRWSFARAAWTGAVAVVAHTHPWH